MTTIVKVPLIDTATLATWLRDVPNDLKEYMDNTFAVIPSPGVLELGFVLTATSPGVYGWQILPTPPQVVPVPLDPADDGKVPTANGGVVTWEAQVGQLPVVNNPADNGKVLTADNGSSLWKPKIEIIDVQNFTRGINNPAVWVKPILSRPDDYVIVQMIGGGGSGAVVETWYQNAAQLFATGGLGGSYAEWSFLASDLDSTMLAYPGKGGASITAAGVANAGKSGFKGTDSIFSSRTPIAIETITIGSPAVVQKTAHGLVTGNVIVFDSVVATGDVANLTGEMFTVTVLGANTFNLVDSTSNTTVALASGLFTSGNYVVIGSDSLLTAGGGVGGVTFASQTNYTNGPNLGTENPIRQGYSTYQGGHILDGTSLSYQKINGHPIYVGTETPKKLVYGGGHGAGVFSSGSLDVSIGGLKQSSVFGGDGGQTALPGTNISDNMIGLPGQFPGGGGAAAGTCISTAQTGAGANGTIRVTVVRGFSGLGISQFAGTSLKV